MSQPDLFASSEAFSEHRPDAEKVRARLERILSEARSADTLPWDEIRLSLYRSIVPRMAGWLPEDEAQSWCLAFEQEIERFAAAA